MNNKHQFVWKRKFLLQSQHMFIFFSHYISHLETLTQSQSVAMMKIIAMKRFGDESIETFRIYAMFIKLQLLLQYTHLIMCSTQDKGILRTTRLGYLLLLQLFWVTHRQVWWGIPNYIKWNGLPNLQNIIRWVRGAITKSKIVLHCM